MGEPNPKVGAHSGRLTKARKPRVEGGAMPPARPRGTKDFPGWGWEAGWLEPAPRTHLGVRIWGASGTRHGPSQPTAHPRPGAGVGMGSR